MDHYILDSNNGQITLTKFLGRTNAYLGALGAAPLGTADGTATGEVGLKVLLVGGTSGALVLGAGTNNIGDVDVASIAAGETHIGQVSTSGDVISVTPTIDTSAYGSGQTLFDATVITNAVRAAGVPAILHSVSLIDKDDEGVAIDLYFFDASVTFGTINENPSISDTDAAKLLGIVSIATSDYKDLGGVKVAHIRNLGIPVEAASGRNIYVAATVTGTPTFTAATDLVFRFGFLW